MLTSLIQDVGPLVHDMTPEELMTFIQETESKRKNASELRKVTKDPKETKPKTKKDKTASAQAEEFLALLLKSS